MFIVRASTELVVTAAWFSVIGAVLLLIAILSAGNTLVTLAVAVSSALAIGGALHTIERSGRLASVASATAIANDQHVEAWQRTAFRQGALALTSSAMAVAVLSLGWDGFRFMPGVLLGAALWLWLDARLLRGWEGDHHADVFRRADWGFAWFKGRSRRHYVAGYQSGGTT